MLGLIRDLLASLRPPVGDFNTAGGDDHDDPETVEWDGGRYLGAQWKPIHPGRQGGAIRPWAVVVHTTDMHPTTFGALVRAWQRDAGRGAGAHFLLGRTPAEGLVQMVDVGRNGNHAGGAPAHGWFVVDGKLVHPNRVSVGIEVHAAGAVRKDAAGNWRTWDDRKPFGAPLDDADVEPDPRRPDRGWHGPTEYQLRELGQLLDAFAHCPAMVAAPKWSVRPNGTPPAYAPSLLYNGHVIVGHTTLDPARKSDPGPVISRWLMKRAG